MGADIRLDILVQVEYIVGIILRLERHQSLVIWSVSGADLCTSFVAEKVHVGPLARKWLQRLPLLTRPLYTVFFYVIFPTR